MSQLESFTPGGGTHLATLGVFAVASFATIARGRQLRGTGGEPKMRRIIGLIGLLVWIASLVWEFLPGNFKLGESFPLQYCDVACVVACLMFLTGHRRAQSVTYFWGIAFTLQAFLTPTLKRGPAHPIFWFFWISHSIILGGAFYCVFVDRFRPRRGDFLFAAGSATAWLVFLVCFDVLTGTNYGFVGNATPENRTLIDFLGPWPSRLVWIYLIALTILILLWLPWHLFKKESPASVAPPV